jgi:alpha-L-fucosidase 2
VEQQYTRHPTYLPRQRVGLDSEQTWLDVARNTIRVMARWLDFNGSNSFFPAAVRVGFDPETILAQLRRYAENTYPNGFQEGNPHGIENFSTVPNTINEMLCTGHVPVGRATNRAESVLRVFPVWPGNRDARFANIRTWGAFLVAGEQKDGQVSHVRILSERGRLCTVQNPWPGREVTVHRNGQPAQTCRGERFTLETECGEILLLQPAGPSGN